MNLLFNGLMDIWQDRKSYAISGSQTVRTADGCCAAVISAGSWQITRDTDVPTGGDRRLCYSMAMVCTAAASSLSSLSQAQMRALVEGFDYAPLFGRPQSIAFWVKSYKAGTHVVAVRNGGASQTYLATYEIATAGVWQEVEIDIEAAPPSESGWNFTTEEGVRLQFALAAGPDKIGLSNQWNAGYLLGTSSQVNLADTVGSYLKIADIRLTPGVGSAALSGHADFASRVSRASRYYSKSYDLEVSPGSVSDRGQMTARSPVAAVQLHVNTGRMRPGNPAGGNAPAVSIYSPQTGAQGYMRDDTAVADVAAVVGSVGETSFKIARVTPSPVGNWHEFHWVDDARL